jgi:hypothetical protein
MAESQISNLKTPGKPWTRWEWALLALIFIVATLLRVYRLGEVPPGFTHDEAGHGHDAIAILHGARPIYQTVGYGREPLYDYLVAGTMALFGPSGGVMRAFSVVLSLLALLATFLWVRLAFDRPTALAAIGLQTASFWSLAVSRQALRSGLLPVLFTLAMYAYWRTMGEAKPTDGVWKSGRPSWALPRPYRYALLCALLIGATLWTYIPARVTWVIFPVFLAYLALAHRPVFRHAWLPTLIAVLLGLLLFVPLLTYLRANPEAEQRLDMLDAPLQALKAGDASVLLDRAWSYASGLFLPGHGDRFLAYNIPGRPTFAPLTGVLFIAGTVLCLERWRRPAYAFALFWFLVGAAPSLITGATASFTRSVAALPVAFVIPALAAVEGARWVAARWGRWAGRATAIGLIVAAIVIGAVSARAYFVEWGESPEVRAAYMVPLAEVARYLDAAPRGQAVGLSTHLPHAPHDPFVFDMSLRRHDLSLRWFNARQAIIIPAERSGSLIALAGVSLDPYFADLPGLQLQERVPLREDDSAPYYDVYDWQPQTMLAALDARARETSAIMGDALELVGYDLRTAQVAPGGTVEAVTLWRVLDPEPLWPQNLSNAEDDLVVFTHAVDQEGNIVGQQDRLDAPAWDWEAGDTIVQIHRFVLPADLSGATITLNVGVYRRSTGVRLPVTVDGIVVGDHVLLQRVEIANE